MKIKYVIPVKNVGIVRLFRKQLCRELLHNITLSLYNSVTKSVPLWNKSLIRTISIKYTHLFYLFLNSRGL